MKRLRFFGTQAEVNDLIAYMDSHEINYSPYTVDGYGREWMLTYTLRSEEEQFVVRMAYKTKGFLPG